MPQATSASFTESRSVQSPWIWRGLLLMSLVALGLCFTLMVGGNVTFGAMWGVIAVGWFGFSMWLWRQHLRHSDR